MRSVRLERLISMYLNICRDSGIYRDCGAVQLVLKSCGDRRLKWTWPRLHGYFGFRLPRAHNQTSCRASCSLEIGQYRDIRGRGYQLVFGSAIRTGWSGQLNRLGPNGPDKLWWIIFSFMLGPGRMNLMGLVLGLGLASEGANILHNRVLDDIFVMCTLFPSHDSPSHLPNKLYNLDKPTDFSSLDGWDCLIVLDKIW
jgi:hypothetical protein